MTCLVSDKYCQLESLCETCQTYQDHWKPAQPENESLTIAPKLVWESPDYQSPIQEDREDGGFSQYPSPIGSSQQSFQSLSLTSMDSRNLEQRDSITGSSSSSRLGKYLLAKSSPVSPTPLMRSLHVPKRQRTTAQRMKLASKAQDSNLDSNPFNVTQSPTGTESGSSHSSESSYQSPQASEYKIIVPCNRSKLILRLLRSFQGMSTSIGEPVVLEKVTERGWKEGLVLIVKTLEASFTAATEINETLLLTNFEVRSTSLTCSDGLIGTQLTWSLKDHLVL